MNPSDWIKAAALITQQKQESATADTVQLSSMPLSQLAMDDSGPPVVHHGMHVPAVTSTPTHAEMDAYTSQQEDTYQQIMPGIPQGSLYPTFASLSSKERTFPEEMQMLQDKVSKGLEKYLQDAKQHRALEVNYFDDNTTGQNAKFSPEDAEQTSTVNIRVTKNPLESLKSDTGHTSRLYLSVRSSAEEKRQQPKTSKEDIEQDVEASNRRHFWTNYPHSVRATTYIAYFYQWSQDANQKGRLHISHWSLKAFLENYPSSSEKQAFLDMLSLLDKYL